MVEVLVMAKFDEYGVEPAFQILLIELLATPFLLILRKIVDFFGLRLFLLATISPKTFSTWHCWVMSFVHLEKKSFLFLLACGGIKVLLNLKVLLSPSVSVLACSELKEASLFWFLEWLGSVLSLATVLLLNVELILRCLAWCVFLNCLTL